MGARLDAGQYPIVGFSQGDRVNILARNSQEIYEVVARNVEVHEVTRLAEGAGASLFAAFLVPEQWQTQVVSAIGSGSVRLGLVQGQAGVGEEQISERSGRSSGPQAREDREEERAA